MSVRERVSQVAGIMEPGWKSPNELPWDPDNTKFPTRKNLPDIPGAPKGAAWVWGKDDSIGRLNLLTPARVKAAATEIKTGQLVPLDLPFNVPETPGFAREKFVHTIKTIVEGIAYDDIYEFNTQCGTQWDGFRHFAHLASAKFYNGIKGEDIVGPNANNKCSIHHWAEHGIAGRGVLLDYRSYAKANGIDYDPYSAHAITYEDLVKCGRAQGIDIRPEAQGGDIKVGDILLIRSGWVESYHERSPEERKDLALRPHSAGPDDGQKYAGVAQEDDMLDWLHDCYFAAVAGDAPAFERWPTPVSYYLHEYILALWGMPLGEMWDLERLAKKCRETGRWFFFLTSAPFNVLAGVGTRPNSTAIF
ncbi:hypothetical protein H103_01256 [Trichophyton rubrum CBS 288.86]|nr:hypothetical protein H100_01252 [Trichophyton rubrum MR850]EZF45723.1 hypothetical protein H102_01248 [Trichophyton rubrum CBS 100081]EZF56427.1 hypothetical protein H103_01256 [Trichophyton rubrum CBS 288.86]EZF67011.1 hypothetical protein H104_01243 [Trichophyton rubrum CBS 289.86]EZF88356.1 hypothetical protein H110_01259 [Trichophyton rubrum MR1448]KMQ44263.1 Kynurenine formamidase [Trichophyton rubrum]